MPSLFRQKSQKDHKQQPRETILTLLNSYAQEFISARVFADRLYAFFKENQQHQDIIDDMRRRLCVYALDYPHIYQFCEAKNSFYCWAVNLQSLHLQPQIGLSRFQLLGSQYILSLATECADEEHSKAITLLEKAVLKYNSFTALLWLHDYYRMLIWQAFDAVVHDAKIIPQIDIAAMYQNLSSVNGKIHGTPFYVLLASFCYWCASYCHLLGKKQKNPVTISTAALYYQEAIKYLFCASQPEVIVFSRAAIENSRNIIHFSPNYLEKYGENNLLSLIDLVTSGNEQVLLDKIVSCSGFKSTEIDRARVLAKNEVQSFIQMVRNHEAPIISRGLFPAGDSISRSDSTAIALGAGAPGPV